MKNIYLTLVFLLFGFLGFGQITANDSFEETTIIKRIDSESTITPSTNKALLSATMSSSNVPTGNSSEVGITEGELSISLNGNAQYTIPIAVPKGINNTEPQISLTYNSQNGLSGSAARGWDITGVSSITRIPSTKFHDGVIDPVDFNALDRFALDGQRLIVKSGTTGVYGADKTVYETEYFSNIKITSLGVSPFGAKYGPASFLVEYPDGSKAYYGNSTDSRSIMEWSIVYYQNPQGVRINYSYILENNSLRINTIKYGALYGLIPLNEVRFIYEDRIFPENSYVGGQNIIRSKKIKEIKVLTSAIGFRNYSFSSPEGDRIVKVTETSGDGTKSYNPTLFDYDRTFEQMKYLTITTALNIGNIKSLNVAAVSGDFNADGKMDCLVYPTIGTDAKTKYWMYADIESGFNMGLEHNVGAFEDIFPATFLSADNKILPQGWVVAKKAGSNYTFTVYSMVHYLGSNNIQKQYERMVSFPNTIYPKKIVSGDFNGDGLTDILAIDTGVTTARNVYLIDLKRDKTTDFLTSPGLLATGLSRTARVEVADFNGDGKSDLFVFDTGFLTIYSLNSENKLVVLYRNMSTDSTLMMGYPSVTTSLPILVGDFNGDGKSDFLIPKTNGSSQWYKYTSTGTTMIKEEKSYQAVFNGNDSYNSYNYIATDFNNDGKTDLIKVNNFTDKTYGYLNLSCYESINGDFVNNPILSNTGPRSDLNIYALPVFLPQSLNNSNSAGNKINSTLEIAFFNQNKIHFFNSAYDYKKSNLITNITTGNGVQETISYIPLDSKFANTYQNTTIYKSSKGIASYPNQDILIDPNLYVVSKLEKQSKDVYKKRLFAYYGAVSNVEGLGFMGFRSVSQTDWYDDTLPMFSSITKNDIDLRGANIENYFVRGFREPLVSTLDTKTPKTIVKGQDVDYIVTGSDNLVATESITLKHGTWIKPGSTFSAKINEGANNSPNTPMDFITKSISNYESNLLANKVFRLKNTSTKQFNTLTNANSETSIAYDTYDNPLKSTTIIKEGTSIVQTTVSDVAYYNNTINTNLASPYIVGRPVSNSQSVSITGNTMSSGETYVYDDNGLLKQVERKGNNTNAITEDNDYDDFGNIINKKITAVGLTPRENSYEYDASGRFLTKVTDNEKLSTSFVYNPNGTLKSQTNPYALTTSFTYDAWFKKRTATDDKLNKTISYDYKRNAEKTIITVTTDALDGSATEETFDDLGRKIKSGQKDLNGNFTYVSFMYDVFDRNYKTSEPYFGATASQWNETKYDIYSRPVESQLFTTRATTVKYDLLTSTITDGQKIKSFVKNAIGNLVSSTETTGGTIKYDYFANGNLKQTDYNGVKINIEQDGWGRKTKITDPSAGTFTYKNNDLGELEVETSKNGEVVTTITRDNNGKPIKKTVIGSGTDTETIYDYDTTTKLLNKTTFKDKKEPAGRNEIITTYTYDDTFKRLLKIVEDKTNVSKFTTTLTYDGLGRIDTEKKEAALGQTKKSVITTQMQYKNGSLYQIVDNDTRKILWQINELNAKGQIRESILGNGIKTTNEYDTNGYVSKIKYDKTTGITGNVLTLDTKFDFKTDNLDNRTNSLFSNYTEDFKYDEIDRLKEFTNRLGIKEIQNYEASGKIKDNDLGTYVYDKAKPYQNTSITLTPEAAGYYSNREGIFNDSMESRTGWSTGAYNAQCISFDNTKAYTGKNAIKINTAASGVTISYVLSDAATQIANLTDTEYTFSGWVFTDNPTAQLTLFMYKNGETGYSNVKSASTTTKGKWVYITEIFKVPANITSLRLRLDVIGSGNVWFDDVQIRKTSNPVTAERKLDITYNAFKSPLQIIETGVDKISFAYNDNNQRSTMYYGSLDDKLLRPLRKHYSGDGTIEIKENITTGKTEFITYIGGDGYSAPIAIKSDGVNTASYLYLHRDYQGTILAITDANATVVEKRLFDAWGSIIKVQDGAGNTLAGLTVLDRGYTGHEHLQSVGLINMNARLYDPLLHRFLQVDNYIQDPTNTQNYNQYGYVLNNPLKYTDPSGNAFNDGKDCANCGPTEVQQTAIGNGIKTIKDNWDDWGIKDWSKKNLNFNSWGKSWNKFWGKGGSNKSSAPANRSSYVNVNSGNYSAQQRVSLIDRFNKAGIDPYAKADVSSNGIAKLLKNVKGLDQAYIDGGRPKHTFDLVGRQYEAITENSVNLNIGILSEKTNLHFAGVLFHEYRHAFQYSQRYTIGGVNYNSRFDAWFLLYGDGHKGERGRWDMMEFDAYSAQYRFGDNEPYVLERMNSYYKYMLIEWIRKKREL